jgi:hypothetical protein
MQDKTMAPTLVLRTIDEQRLGIRFQRIGRPQRFNTILQRLRSDFPLTNCEEIENQPWWIVTIDQKDQVVDFCHRNGLRLVTTTYRL